MNCESCGEETDVFVGCSRCGKLVCPACEAAVPDDEAGEPICEECF
jgi:hypothetical protein